MTPYTDDDIATVQRIADECDYSLKDMQLKRPELAHMMRMLSTRMMLSSSGESTRTLHARRRAERCIAAFRKHNNDWHAAANEVHVSHSTFRYYLAVAGYRVKQLAQHAVVRNCAECGAPFQSTNNSRVLCSNECRKVRAVRTGRERWRIRNGFDPHDPHREEMTRIRNMQALTQYFGRPKLIQRMAGIHHHTLDSWVKRHDMREFQARCQQRERDPEFIAELLRENDYHIGKAARAMWRSRQFLYRALDEAGRRDVVDNAPCPECGASVKRTGIRRSMCSDECRRKRNCRQQRETKRRRKAKCINQSQSPVGSDATPS